jgi:hypothetical protein
MRPHPRIRKTIKWSGAAALVLTLAAWVASGVWMLEWSRAGRLLLIYAGVVELGQSRGLPSHIRLYSIAELGARWHFYWLPRAHRDSSVTAIHIPLWIPALPLLLATAAAWRLDTLARRRLRAGAHHCPICNYDLTGLPTRTGACPECGTRRPT